MAANIASNLETWSKTAASNQPDDTDTADIVADLRQIQSVVRKYLRNIGADIASASTTDLSGATGDYVNITGTTTITGLGTVSAGMRFILSFAGALTLTHNATSLILPTGGNIVTKAGDIAVMESLGSGNWKCIYFSNSSGNPFLQTGTGAVITTVESKLREIISPKDFGAVGDGVTDDTAAWTNFAAATGIKVVTPGQYLVSGIVQDYSNGFIYGDTEATDVLDTKLDDSEGAVTADHFGSKLARTVLGNPESYAANPVFMGMAQFFTMIGVEYSGDADDGGVSLPHTVASLPAQNYELRYGTGTSSASAEVSVVFDTVFPNTCAFVLAVTAGLGNLKLYPATANVFNKSASGFDINVCNSSGRVAETFNYIAIGR